MCYTIIQRKLGLSNVRRHYLRAKIEQHLKCKVKYKPGQLVIPTTIGVVEISR